jgi:acyl-CoA synthetase (NDP forming)
LKDGDGWIEADAVFRMLSHYGIRAAVTKLARTPEQASAMAEEIGFPVALKIDSEKLTHKSDIGGVVLGLASSEEVERAASDLAERVAQHGADLRGFVVQEMVPKGGVEMFVGVTHDPSFGPIVACGAGGTLVELMRDVRVRITPLTDVDARHMIRGLRTYPLLEGYRGSPPLDVATLEETLLRVAAMVEAVPQIIELDLNPVMVLPDGSGCIVADARMRIAPAAPRAPRGARPALR